MILLLPYLSRSLQRHRRQLPHLHRSQMIVAVPKGSSEVDQDRGQEGLKVVRLENDQEGCHGLSDLQIVWHQGLALE